MTRQQGKCLHLHYNIRSVKCQVKYEDLQVGATMRYGDCKPFLGDELTFEQLVYVPGTEKLIILMLCTVNGPEDDDDCYVGQITRVIDNEEGYEEYADVILDLPGFDKKPSALILMIWRNLSLQRMMIRRSSATAMREYGASKNRFRRLSIWQSERLYTANARSI